MITNATIPVHPAAAQATNDIRALKPPIEIPNGWLWVWGVLGVLALAAIVWLVWRYTRKQATYKELEEARRMVKEALPADLEGQPPA